MATADIMGLLVTMMAEQKAAQAEQKAAQAEQKAALAEQKAALDELTKEVKGLKGRLAELQAEEVASAATPKEYEDAGRTFISDELERRFGLRAIAGASPNRVIDTLQWDYRMPVTVLGAPPTHPGKQGEDFIIFPSMERYTCPPRPAMGRHLSPTKTPGAAAPPACDYIVIFEITTSRSWSAGSRPMLVRLEERLHVTLDRARAMAADIPADILSVCALVGIVAPASCQDSVSAKMENAANNGSLPLLSKMMGEGRFVFLRKSFP